MKKYFFILTIFFIYFLVFDTRIYSFQWEFGEKTVKGIKFYFITNPPKDKFEKLNLIVKHINEESEAGRLTNTNMVYYIKETWQTNRFFNINEYWNMDEAWQDFGISHQVGYFILTSENWNKIEKTSKKLISCYNIELKNYMEINDRSNANIKYGPEFRSFYFKDGILNNTKRHWLRVYYCDNAPIFCDLNYRPKDLIKGKYEFL